MLPRNEFEARLAEYLYGELPADQQQEVTEYLEAHPEAAQLEKDLRTLVEVGREVAGTPIPEGMVPRIVQDVSAHLGRQTVEGAPRLQEVSRDGKWVPWRIRPGRRRLFLSRTRKGLAALAAIAAVLVVYWFARELAWARVYAETLSRLKKVRSFQVKGTILAPGGNRQPFHMWLQAPEVAPWVFFRIEIGEPGQRRIIVDKRVQRLIFSEKDQHYYLPKLSGAYMGSDGGGSMDQLVENDLRPPAHLPIMPGVEKEDREDITRYVIEREGASRKFIIEIDRARHLLKRAVIMDRDQDQWVMVSDLSYGGFGSTFPDSLFSVEPPEGATPIPDTEGEQWWYERSLTARSAIFPSTLQTATMTADCSIELVQPPTNDGVVYDICTGGACEATVSKGAILDIFRHVGKYDAQTADPVLQRQTVSLKMRYRDGLSRERRLAGLSELLGVKTVVTPWRDTLEIETKFEQDGRPLPVSASSHPEWPKFEVLEGNRVHISSQCVRLEQFIGHVWAHSEQAPGGSYLVNRPVDPDAYDPFEALINVDYIASRNWAENAAWLAEHLGVTYRTEQRAIRVRHIQVSPGLPTPDGVSSYSQYAVGQLEDCYPNPANPNTTIPFVLEEDADVALRIFSDQGQLVRTVDLGKLIQGRHEVSWEGQDQTGQPVAAGTYRYRLEVNGIATSAKKVDLLR
jgi:anti-sigma factor RsiW